MKKHKKLKTKVEVSVVILNYNTKDLSLECISTVMKHTNGVNYEIVVVDNGSSDGSVEEFEKLKKNFRNIKLIMNDANLGFAKGNNTSRKIVEGKYVLFLNSDTLFVENSIKKCVDYLNKNNEVGALTCKQVLLSGQMDKDSMRSFPTPWVALTHFSKLDKIFPKSKLFARYWCGHLDYEHTYEIEVLQGAYFMAPLEVLEKVEWFDEDYFLDGEDIDLSWKIMQAGYKNVYFANTQIIHLKGATKGKGGGKKLFERIKYVTAGVDAMEIFYRKRMWNEYALPINYLVILSIKVLKAYRITRLII